MSLFYLNAQQGGHYKIRFLILALIFLIFTLIFIFFIPPLSHWVIWLAILSFSTTASCFTAAFFNMRYGFYTGAFIILALYILWNNIFSVEFMAYGLGLVAIAEMLFYIAKTNRI